MAQRNHLRRRRAVRVAAACCCALLAIMAAAQDNSVASGGTTQGKVESHGATGQSSPGGMVAVHGRVRAAEDAYLAGAKRLDRDDLNGAEKEFARALALDPENREYAVAITLAREHRLTELVQQASRARLAGDAARAETLIAEARAIDPANAMVLEHSGPGGLAAGSTPQAAGGASGSLLGDRAQLVAASGTQMSGRLALPAFAGSIHLRPADGVKSFHLRGVAPDVVREVASAYGIKTVVEDAVERKNVRFDLEGQGYEQAMGILLRMLGLMAVPVDETTILVAKNDEVTRLRLQRLLEETIYLPGLTTEQINDLGNMIRNVYEVRQATVQTGIESIVVRAPEDVLTPMNRTLEDLLDANGEVMLDVKLYEITTTRTRNIGAVIPTQAGIYNVEAAATSLVNANQTLVQQAIAQGFVSSTASNIDIALALIGSGLVQSSLLSSTIGFFGHGLTQTGITGSTNTAFNLALNQSDTRALDDVQIRIGDRQPAVFRSGTKYPITSSTYTSGLSTAASALSNATINGVSVASLLAQYAGGSSATIPQVTYEDLGVTLKATPMIQRSGRINLLLDMKIEALAGGSANGIPVLANRQFQSDITVGNGETAMLVSNMNRTESAAVTGIPGLSELPGFQVPIADSGEKDAGQLVVLVTPHVVRGRLDVVASPKIVVRPVHETVFSVN